QRRAARLGSGAQSSLRDHGVRSLLGPVAVVFLGDRGRLSDCRTATLWNASAPVHRQDCRPAGDRPTWQTGRRSVRRPDDPTMPAAPRSRTARPRPGDAMPAPAGADLVAALDLAGGTAPAAVAQAVAPA